MEDMTLEEMFGAETDEAYIARTTEEDRVKEAIKYISGIVAGKMYEEGYSTDNHIDDLTARGYWKNERAGYLKAYLDGFKAGYTRGTMEETEKQKQRERAAAFAEIMP